MIGKLFKSTLNGWFVQYIDENKRMETFRVSPTSQGKLKDSDNGNYVEFKIARPINSNIGGEMSSVKYAVIQFENKDGKPKPKCCKEIVSGFELGTTCPTCNKPFRSVIQEPKEETVSQGKCTKCGNSQYKVGKPFCTDDFCNKDFFQEPKAMYTEEDIINCWKEAYFKGVMSEGKPLSEKVQNLFIKAHL
jgi:Zn ribbon nucleic-acid-binding protein